MKNKIIYDGRTFTTLDIKSCSLHLASSLLSSQLEANTLTAVVKSEDKSLTEFTRNTPLYYYHRGRLVCISYVQTVDRIGPNKYKFYGTSAIGRLIEQPHRGGVYTGQTAEEVIAGICGTIPFELKGNIRETKLYGWLPYADPPKRSARDNLSQVLFAIGASLRTDLDGVLRIENLWDGLSGSIGKQKIYTGANVSYKSPVSSVSVKEHQYAKGGEEAKLFEGVTQEGDVITFSEPMHTLTASGFTILESNANYAKVSAGSGVLTGRKYVHNTRQVTRSVGRGRAGDGENVRTVTDATLVSLANSSAVAERMANYYQCSETIMCDVVLDWQLPGDVISAYHPYDKTTVSACIESLDINMSGTLKAKAAALVGFTPMQIESSGYLNNRVMLTGSGEWVPPAGVTRVHYVLFSGAQGGQAGEKGGDSGSAKSHNYTHTSSISGKVTLKAAYRLWGAGGKGGSGGLGGKGSKILEGDIEITPGQALSYSSGVGGIGATFSAEEPKEGAEGTDTVFAEFSTAQGTYPPASGWQDPFTQEIFAKTGPNGLPGGDGAGEIPGYSIPDTNDLDQVLKYQPSTGAYDEDGNLWPGAATHEKSEGVAWYSLPWRTNESGSGGAQNGYGLGPGGVAGRTQEMPPRGGSTYVTEMVVTADAASGLTPPAPIAPRERSLTIGGMGGYGGGGGSAPSWAGTEIDPSGTHGTPPSTVSVTPGNPGIGGPAGPGSEGGDGCIILFYATQAESTSGAFITQDGKFYLDGLGRFFVG